MHAPHDKTRADQAPPPAVDKAPGGSMKRWVRSEFATVGLVVAAILLSGAAAWWASSVPATTNAAVALQKGKGKGGGGAGVPVETAVSRAEKRTTDIPAVGNLRSDENVQIAPEVAGRIANIAFEEGEAVKQGDVLIRLDDALARAELAEAEARFNLAKANFDRAETLTKSRNIAERAYDEARANFETARAAVELARVRVDKHEIRAPFPGVVGIRMHSIGAFVSIGTTIVNLEKIDVLKVDFKVPEIFYSDVHVGQSIEVTADALPGRTFSAEIYAINPLVDVNGRALQVRARLANPELVLRPGLFARVSVKGKQAREVVLVPESALVPRGGETFVFRVEGGKAVESKINVGGRLAGEVEIIEGLDSGATIVVAGHQRLRDGIAVDVVTAAPPRQGGGS
jgi:membrane fusion protein, multidrug efflux system